MDIWKASAARYFALCCCALCAVPWASAETDSAGAKWHKLMPKGDSQGIYEPSAVRQLADGRLLLVQDESDDPFVLVRLTRDGQGIDIQRPTLNPEDRPFWILGQPEPPRGLEDLEGLASAADGYLYAITSHSRTVSGNRRKSRERLARLRIVDGHISELQVFGKLRKAILAAYPELKGATQSSHTKGRKGFNIEGLCFDREGKRLYIGLRAPVLDGDSLILVLENPMAMFRDDAGPVFASEPLRLDLDQGGIRAISYVAPLDSYLLVTQRSKKKGTSGRPFRLWSWSGQRGSPARPVQIPGIELRNTEGIAPIRHEQRDYLMLVSDDGDRAEKRPAHYLLVPLGALGLPLSPR